MMWRALVLVLVLVVVVLASTASHKGTPSVLGTSTEMTATPVVVVSASANGEFNAVGTLVFYPNNVGPVPYLFYQNVKGAIVAKALVFDALPPTDFSSWSGARVRVIGLIDNEHVVVSSMSYLSPP